MGGSALCKAGVQEGFLLHEPKSLALGAQAPGSLAVGALVVGSQEQALVSMALAPGALPKELLLAVARAVAVSTLSGADGLSAKDFPSKADLRYSAALCEAAAKRPPGAKGISFTALVMPAPGDGSCLFHALSALLSYNGTFISPTALRVILVDWLEENSEFDGTSFADWICFEFPGLSLGAYLSNMRKPGVSGGAIELRAFCRYFNYSVDILVYDLRYAVAAGCFLRTTCFLGPSADTITTRHANLLRSSTSSGAHHYDLLLHCAKAQDAAKGPHRERKSPFKRRSQRAAKHDRAAVALSSTVKELQPDNVVPFAPPTESSAVPLVMALTAASNEVQPQQAVLPETPPTLPVPKPLPCAFPGASLGAPAALSPATPNPTPKSPMLKPQQTVAPAPLEPAMAKPQATSPDKPSLGESAATMLVTFSASPCATPALPACIQQQDAIGKAPLYGRDVEPSMLAPLLEPGEDDQKTQRRARKKIAKKIKRDALRLKKAKAAAAEKKTADAAAEALRASTVAKQAEEKQRAQDELDKKNERRKAYRAKGKTVRARSNGTYDIACYDAAALAVAFGALGVASALVRLAALGGAVVAAAASLAVALAAALTALYAGAADLASDLMDKKNGGVIKKNDVFKDVSGHLNAAGRVIVARLKTHLEVAEIAAQLPDAAKGPHRERKSPFKRRSQRAAKHDRAAVALSSTVKELQPDNVVPFAPPTESSAVPLVMALTAASNEVQPQQAVLPESPPTLPVPKPPPCAFPGASLGAPAALSPATPNPTPKSPMLKPRQTVAPAPLELAMAKPQATLPDMTPPATLEPALAKPQAMLPDKPSLGASAATMLVTFSASPCATPAAPACIQQQDAVGKAPLYGRDVEPSMLAPLLEPGEDDQKTQRRARKKIAKKIKRDALRLKKAKAAAAEKKTADAAAEALRASTVAKQTEEKQRAQDELDKKMNAERPAALAVALGALGVASAVVRLAALGGAVVAAAASLAVALAAALTALAGLAAVPV
ncbi:hypothetical protein M885DRAFT_623308 [Pelagophyceae sp. CCMP2097]|nr:hypothetical protein M885DRAFT_623308 [Pelagophyceae sp. CCMP2097]